MNYEVTNSKEPYRMEYDAGTIKHLGLQMYSTLPPVIGELVANAWDANATRVEIKIPEEPINEETTEITISDNGIGMSDEDVRNKYLIIGRDRRVDEGTDVTPVTSGRSARKIMGRKGIGKFSAFGIAQEIAVESVKDDDVSHFQMNYRNLLAERKREIEFPPLEPTGTVLKGTKITLRDITKFRNRSISISAIRRKLARRFSVIGQGDFEVIINDEPISVEERNLKPLLEKDMDGKPYLWEYNNEEIQPETGWKVSGWIGALDKTSSSIDEIDRGIVLMARGKLVQEPFFFHTGVGQQYALSYLVGELHVEFVDENEDTIGTTRSSLVWETEPNAALMKWGQNKVNKIAREWGEKRRKDKERQLEKNKTYLEFREQAAQIDKKREFKHADQLVRGLIRQSIDKNPDAEIDDFKPMVQMFLDFWKFDSFREMAEDVKDAGIEEPEKLLNLFREWEILEAKEMAKVTEGRIMTIEKLHNLIETNALEVPTLHNFLKEFPWVIDPRWTLVADEVRYSDLLRERFPERNDIPEVDRRIDFLCVREGTHLVVVEIKRPKSKASVDELNQIEDYVSFMRDHIKRTTDPHYQYNTVTGYLLCGNLVDTYKVREKRENLAEAGIYIKRYEDLLEMVQRSHTEFLKRYNKLQEVKQRAENNSHS